MAIYAMIGTRDPSEIMRKRMFNIAARLVAYGHEVATGGADGIDEEAMKGAASVDASKLHVFLPWAAYNQNKIPFGCSTYVFSESTCPSWNASVDKYHPNPGALTRGPRALHARNFGIVMYPEPVDGVIAVPQSQANPGGTGQGMRIALGEGVPLYDMTLLEDRMRFKAILDGYKK